MGNIGKLVGKTGTSKTKQKKVPNKVIESSEIKTYIIGRGKSLVLSH